MSWNIQNLNGISKIFKTCDSAEARAWMKDRSLPEVKTARTPQQATVKTVSKVYALKPIAETYSTTAPVPRGQKIKHNRCNGPVTVIKF